MAPAEPSHGSSGGFELTTRRTHSRHQKERSRLVRQRFEFQEFSVSRYQALRQAALIIVSVPTLMFGIEARAVDIEPLHVDIDVYGQAFLGEGCEGGEWSVSWSADVPGETNNISDLLISY